MNRLLLAGTPLMEENFVLMTMTLLPVQANPCWCKLPRACLLLFNLLPRRSLSTGLPISRTDLGADGACLPSDKTHLTSDCPTIRENYRYLLLTTVLSETPAMKMCLLSLLVGSIRREPLSLSLVMFVAWMITLLVDLPNFFETVALSAWYICLIKSARWER